MIMDPIMNSLAFVPVSFIEPCMISISWPPSPPIYSSPALSCRHHHRHCARPKVATSVPATATSSTRRDFLHSLFFTATAIATATSVTALSTAADAAATTTSVSSHQPSHALPPPPSSSVQPSDLDVARATDLLQAHCLPFLQAISPLSLDALLYRGHPLPLSLPLHSTSARRNDSIAPKLLRLTLDTSSGDLFDADTYGVDDRAAVPFFHALDSYLATLESQSLPSGGIDGSRRRRRHRYWDGKTIDAEDSTRSLSRSQSQIRDVPRVRGAHIGTGSPDDAAQWGVPLTVWPIGSNVRFAVWDTTTPTTSTSTSTSTNVTQQGSMDNDGLTVDDENVMVRHDPRRFIYARGDIFHGALAAKGSLAFDHDSLRAGLVRGHEVLFQCSAFYVMPQQLVAPVLHTLGAHGASVHADHDR